MGITEREQYRVGGQRGREWSGTGRNQTKLCMEIPLRNHAVLNANFKRKEKRY